MDVNVEQTVCSFIIFCDRSTKPMQYIPISAVPLTNTRRPKPHYYTERERGGRVQ